MTMKINKILIILSILFLIIFLSSCNNNLEEKSVKYYWTWIVSTWTISLENSFVWYIEWDDTINLSTKVWWRISQIYVDKWDYVKEWQLLAVLDSTESKVWYDSAENIVDSLYKLEKSTWEMFDEQIKAMQSKVEQVKIWEKWLKDGLSDTISITNAQLQTAKTWVETAKANLEHTKKILETKITNIYDNSRNAIVWSVILDTNIINFIDTLIWVTEENRDKNDSFQDYLSAKDSKYLSESKTKFLEVNKIYLEYKDFYDNKIDWKNPDKETILIWLKKWEIVAEELKTLLSLVYNVLDNSIDNYNFSLSTINNYKNNISNFWTNIESSLLTISWDYILWLKWSIQWLNDFDESSKMQLDLLQKQLLLAENTYSQYEAMSEWQIREITVKWDVSTSQFYEIDSWLNALKKQKETSLNEIKTKINEVIWQKNSAWVMISNWEIRSPINWVITSKLAEEWQVIWWWMTFLVVSSDKNLKVNINVWEDQISNFTIWNSILIEINWLNKQVTWKISNIFPSKDIITKKIWIEILLNPILDLWNNVIIWSYAKVILNNTQENIWIIIPNSAIISRFMIPWVYVLKDWIVKFKNIEILRQNNNFSEISWLEIWEVIIIDWKENIWDWEELK